MPKVTTTYKVVPVTSYEVVVFEEIVHDDGATSFSEDSFGLYRSERGAETAVRALKALDAAGVPNG